MYQFVRVCAGGEGCVSRKNSILNVCLIIENPLQNDSRNLSFILNYMTDRISVSILFDDKSFKIKR